MKNDYKFNLIFDEQDKDLQKLIDELLLKMYISEFKKYSTV